MRNTKNENKTNDQRPVIRSLADLEKYQKEHRSKDMLTVKDLIAYLKKQKPDACVLGYESNSSAYIEQSKNLSHTVMTVREDKVRAKEDLEHWYKGYPKKKREARIKKDLDELFRYSEDDDVIIKIGG